MSETNTNDLPPSLSEAAVAVLEETAPDAKVALTRIYAAAWREGRIASIGRTPPPDRPARPERPLLLPPGKMPKRRKGGLAGRTAFVHAIAHIELNAIDLAWDIVARFTADDMPTAFYDDWVDVARDEAEHFALLAERLAELGAAYGDLPAHDGLWQAAIATADDLMARLAVVPMILEARGLDTTPSAIERLEHGGDDRTAEILQTIADEEVPHVAAGVRWFEFLCQRLNMEPVPTFKRLARDRFPGVLKPPFNEAARQRAGMNGQYYQSA